MVDYHKQHTNTPGVGIAREEDVDTLVGKVLAYQSKVLLPALRTREVHSLYSFTEHDD